MEYLTLCLHFLKGEVSNTTEDDCVSAQKDLQPKQVIAIPEQSYMLEGCFCNLQITMAPVESVIKIIIQMKTICT